jgi:hypothetical protein
MSPTSTFQQGVVGVEYVVSHGNLQCLGCSTLTDLLAIISTGKVSVTGLVGDTFHHLSHLVLMFD